MTARVLPKKLRKSTLAAATSASIALGAVTLTVASIAAQASNHAEADRPDASNVATVSSMVDTPRVDVTATTVVDALEQAWGMALLNEEAVLVTERPGRLLRVDLASGATTPIAGLPRVHAQGQGGLLDVALHPEFDDNRWVYLTYSAATDGGTATHLGRGRLNAEATQLDDFEVLLVAGPGMRSNAHYGSRIAFDGEGHVFITTGDRNRKDFGPEHVSQNLGVRHGKVLRVRDDGTIPEDNPFVGRDDADDAIWSYGHRNPQGLGFHPETGALWSNEHGENNGDEINVIERGANFGWPIATWGVSYRTGERFAPTPPEVADTVDPVFWWTEDDAEGFPPSGLAFYSGEAFADWQGHLLMGNLAHRFLGVFAVEHDDEGRPTVTPVARVLDGRHRLRDVLVHPDGSLLVITAENRGPMLRLTPRED